MTKNTVVEHYRKQGMYNIIYALAEKEIIEKHILDQGIHHWEDRLKEGEE